ncbi:MULTISPECIES: hypothetical protein [Brevibacillus]|uniref:hypothetical protein n=1 Tax=Brevibacillus TaxID=55080 RepID=UPI000271888E|nr:MULTISPECIES: hypothetical protein [Brevibacillus]EJL39139.1 hypothetical protein PMI08_05111 [Brevibacillus sp. CF112]MBY0054934.1 hypothetical protein [Brevibacillus agri]MDN4094849.1 hypothetical protein [Brevibacillus agri]MDR9505854.1 hypothetical protein [Brevibacillus agri]MED3501777.1 hypothetical protein [Brevibacillus agri]
MMTTMMQKLFVKASFSLRNQKGAQSIEWITLAAVVLAVLGAVATFFSKDENVGNAVSNTLSEVIGHIGDKITGD